MSPLWTNAATAAVYSRLPPFWPANAKAWFLQAEAQFTLRGITQDVTKHVHVIASLDERTAAKVADLLAASSAADDNKYAHLKQRLLERFQLSEQERARRLLELRGLGDRKPSELMEEVLALLQDEPFSFIIKELYLQQLPPVVRAQLANTNFAADPRQAATYADRLWFAAGQHALPITTARSPAGESPSAADEPQSDALEINAIDRATRPYRRAHPPRCAHRPAAPPGTTTKRRSLLSVILRSIISRCECPPFAIIYNRALATLPNMC